MNESCIPSKEYLETLLDTRIRLFEPLVVKNGGCHSRVFIVETDTDSFIMKIPRGRQGYYTAYLPSSVDLDNWFDQHWAITTAQRLLIPAPSIVFSSKQSPRFVIMTKLPGVPVTDYGSWNGCPYDEAEFGTILSKLHSLTVNGYGPIDDFGNTYFHAWPDFLMAVAEKAIGTCLERNSISNELYGMLKNRWLPMLPELRSKKASLLHLESLGFANILYDSDSRRITGFLDYEDCIGGDPLFELMWMCYYYGDRDSNQTYFNYKQSEKGYCEWPEDEFAATLYRPFMYLDKLTWIDPKGERAQDHNQALKRVCSMI